MALLAFKRLSLASRSQARAIATSAAQLEAAITTPAPSNALTHVQWTHATQRTGVLARKQGMTCLWSDGIRVPVTVLHVRRLFLLAQKEPS